MKGYKVFFEATKKVVQFLRKKFIFFTMAGIIFASLFFIAFVCGCLYKYTGLEVFNIIFLIDSCVLIDFLICLIPIANEKYIKTLKNISHKSYLFFIFFMGLLSWGTMLGIKNFLSSDFRIFFYNNTINIMFTLYAIFTILWFVYHLLYSDSLSILRKQLQVYFCIVTLLQLFFVNKFKSFEYCISILIASYTYIQYLFEVKSLELEEKAKK